MLSLWSWAAPDDAAWRAAWIGVGAAKPRLKIEAMMGLGNWQLLNVVKAGGTGPSPQTLASVRSVSSPPISCGPPSLRIVGRAAPTRPRSGQVATPS